MREARELIDQFHHDFPSIQDAVRQVLAKVPNLPPETVEALHRLENYAWPDHDLELFKQTIASIDMSEVRRLMEERAQGK